MMLHIYWCWILPTTQRADTGNAYEDGVTGNSYLGWISGISRKLHLPRLVADEMINLYNVHPSFQNEKIEGVCVEAVKGNKLFLHLVADNDKGTSTLFHVSLQLGV